MASRMWVADFFGGYYQYDWGLNANTPGGTLASNMGNGYRVPEPGTLLLFGTGTFLELPRIRRDVPTERTKATLSRVTSWFATDRPVFSWKGTVRPMQEPAERFDANSLTPR